MKKLVLAIIASCFCVSANAACTRADLNGSWVAYSTGSDSAASRTKFAITAKSNIALAQSVSTLDVNQAIPETLNITSIAKDCVFLGNIVNDYGTAMISGTMTKTKDSIIGIWFQQDASNNYRLIASGAFSAIKQ